MEVRRTVVGDGGWKDRSRRATMVIRTIVDRHFCFGFLHPVCQMAQKCLADSGFLDGPFKSRSILDVLSGSSSDVSFPELKPSSFRGLPSMWISEEEIITLVAPFQFSLVGFFPFKWPSFDSIRRFFFQP
ncbi:hypothetical protein IEQ34_003850 [Dendrobium chrysotoxum]|uniref:Uncharacterized protein n=1 Tax=Dendrobium chrysotoxum TaxID=161865 RepID=A0AAV7HE72_DENCH|nr:hypothetical protein IEQ34_003850 [Dendrobium chrysotoxum]